MENDNSPVKENAQLAQQPFAKKGGRIVGSKNRINPHGIRKLDKLKFDPIDELVSLYRKNNKEIERLERLQMLKDLAREEGVGVNNGYSGMQHAALLAAQQKLLMDLVPYRYAKVPVDVNINDKNALPPIMISLTKQGEVYEINPGENVDINEMDHLAYKGDDEDNC